MFNKLRVVRLKIMYIKCLDKLLTCRSQQIETMTDVVIYGYY